MQERLDATQGASSFALAVREKIMTEFPECVANIGNMDFDPGAYNIIPSRVSVALEFRSPEISSFHLLEKFLLDIARQSADRFGLGLETDFLGKHVPTSMDTEIQASFQRAADSLGLSTVPISSGAGHDAQALAEICPSGMIFVPSVGGASHSPREYTHWHDCINGANTLLQAVLDYSKNVQKDKISQAQ